MARDPSSIGFWVGTYTTPASHVPGACGKGILRGKLDLLTGGITLTVVAAGAPDPSYLAAGHGRLFAVAEKPGTEGGFLVYRAGGDGSLALEAKYPSGGSHPCHLAAVENEVALANYMGDRLQIFAPRKGEAGWVRREGAPYAGTGPVTSRQEAPHPHQVTYLESLRQLAVCDLGSDRIWLHRVGALGIEADAAGYMVTPPGTGPRHLVQGPGCDHVYVLGEFSGRILHYRREAGNWNLIADWPTVDSPGIDAGGAAIKLHPSGKSLYASVRSTGQIFMFRIHGGSGGIELAGAMSSGGKGPRDIAIDPTGRWLIALNQDSNSISCFPLDSGSGLPTGEPGPVVSCGTPVCLVFA
jgi:6-phosphogluconolactonase